MAIISKHISWTGATKKVLSELLTKFKPKINVTWLSDSEAYVVGESIELTNYKDYLATQGIIVTILGDGPAIPVPIPPEPIPSGIPTDNIKWQKAWNKIRQQDRLSELNRVDTEYDLDGGTRT